MQIKQLTISALLILSTSALAAPLMPGAKVTVVHNTIKLSATPNPILKGVIINSSSCDLPYSSWHLVEAIAKSSFADNVSCQSSEKYQVSFDSVNLGEWTDAVQYKRDYNNSVEGCFMQFRVNKHTSDFEIAMTCSNGGNSSVNGTMINLS